MREGENFLLVKIPTYTAKHPNVFMYNFLHRMWAASTQHFNALLQLDPNNTQARIHRARAQYKLVNMQIYHKINCEYVSCQKIFLCNN